MWLASLVFLVVALVVVGGLTRLTGSGLSIVEWQPLMGVIPPLSTEDWQGIFEKYQMYPQYKLHPLELAEFKAIFYWEYAHRVLGRVLGLAFLGPFLYFLKKRLLTKSLIWKLVLCFIAGGFQGFLGWFMVKSGLVDVPQVSHLRLAAHLSLALFLACSLLWLFWDAKGQLKRAPMILTRFRLPQLSVLLLSVVCLQIVFGAFTAGLHGGLIYNTFPTMNGYLIPPDLGYLEPAWKNVVANLVTIQFIHRLLGLLTLILAILYSVIFFSIAPRGLGERFSVGLLLFSVFCQVALGIATLILQVPIALASLHQLGATLVLFSCLYQVFLWWRKTSPLRAEF